jgi:hypothetical protein
VAFYKQVLPLRLVLIGKSKGRTVKALRERVDALSLNQDTRGIGGVLNAYHTRVKVAHSWRGGRIVHTLGDEQYKLEAEMIEHEVPNLPSDICQHALQRRLCRLLATQTWLAYVQCSLPFKCNTDTTTVFSLMNAMMKYLPRVDKWRIAVCQRSLVESHICPWIRDGEEKSEQLSAMLGILTSELAKEDPFDMDVTNASFYTELLHVSEGMLTIISLSFSSLAQTSVAALGSSGPKAVASPTELVASAISDSAFYDDRRLKYQRALPAIIEHEVAVTANQGYLASLPKEFDVAWVTAEGAAAMKRIGDMLDGLLAILGTAAVEFGVLREYHALIGERTGTLSATISSLAVDGEVDMETIDVALTMMQAASMVFPLDPSFAETTTVLATIKTSAVCDARKENFIKILSEATTLDGDKKNNYMVVMKLKDVIAAHTGMLLSESSFSIVVKVAETICGIMKDPEWEEVLFQNLWQVANSVLNFAPASPGTLRALRCLQTWRAVLGSIRVADVEAYTQTQLQSLGKLMEDLRMAAHQMMPTQLNDDCETIRLFVEKAYFVHLGVFEQLTSAVTSRSKQAIAECTTPLQQYIDAAKDGPKTWNDQTKGFKLLHELFTLVATKALFTPLHEDMQTSIGKLHGAIAEHTALLGFQGCAAIDADPIVVASRQIAQTALRLHVELSLLQSFQIVNDSDKVRACVQAQIKRLRAEHMKERDAIHHLVYKAAFAALTIK